MRMLISNSMLVLFWVATHRMWNLSSGTQQRTYCFRRVTTTQSNVGNMTSLSMIGYVRSQWRVTNRQYGKWILIPPENIYALVPKIKLGLYGKSTVKTVKIRVSFQIFTWEQSTQFHGQSYPSKTHTLLPPQLLTTEFVFSKLTMSLWNKKISSST